MGILVIEESLRSQLKGLKEEIELYDESGRVIGHILPPDLYRQLACAYGEKHCPYTKEELQRRRKETGGRSLAEIWMSLGQTNRIDPNCPKLL
jgi:hypothetical protein